MKKSALAFFAAFFPIFILASHPASAASLTYEQKVSVNGEDIATIKVWSKDKYVKTESEFQGMHMMMLRNDKGVFSYYPEQKTATKLPPELDRPNLTTQIPEYKAFLEANKAQKVGSEILDGRNVDVYTYTEPSLQRPAKAWVWPEKNFPLQIEVNAPEGKTLIQIQNVKFDAEISPSEFELPADAKILDLNAIQAPPPPAQEAPAAAPPLEEAAKPAKTEQQ